MQCPEFRYFLWQYVVKINLCTNFIVQNNQVLNINITIRTGKANALCKSTLYDRMDGTQLTFRAFLSFTPTGDESNDHAHAALPPGKDLPDLSDRRVGGSRGLSECGDEEN
jgi:hypothetical protein